LKHAIHTQHIEYVRMSALMPAITMKRSEPPFELGTTRLIFELRTVCIALRQAQADLHARTRGPITIYTVLITELAFLTIMDFLDLSEMMGSGNCVLPTFVHMSC
jgi:hypothetical protein